MDYQQERNPARARLQHPFLKRARPRPSPPSPVPLANKKPFCSGAIAVKQQSARKTVVGITPPSSNSKPSTSEYEEVDRELVRKKSELLLLNLKCIELQEKYGALMDRSKRSTGTYEEADGESHSTEGHSTIQRRGQRLLAIRKRLQSLDFTNCCRMAVSVRR